MFQFSSVTQSCPTLCNPMNHSTPGFVLQSYLKQQNLKVKVKVVQSCPILCNPMDYTVHGILQARILEWVAFPLSRGSSQPRDSVQFSSVQSLSQKPSKHLTAWWNIVHSFKMIHMRISWRSLEEMLTNTHILFAAMFKNKTSIE